MHAQRRVCHDQAGGAAGPRPVRRGSRGGRLAPGVDIVRRRHAGIVAIAVLAAALVVVAPHPASAATTYTWKGDGDAHSWGQEKNWDPEGTPQDGDSVVIGTTQLTDSPHIIGAPTISLESFSMSGGAVNGPFLESSSATITTKTLNWTQGTIAASIVVTTGGQMLAFGVDSPKIPPTLSNGSTAPGAPPVSFINSASMAQSGTFRLSCGQGCPSVVNDGNWFAGPGTIASSNCCTSPAVFANHGSINLAGNLTFDHMRFRARPHSDVGGNGRLEIFGGVPDLTGPWNLAGPDTVLSLTDVQAATIQGTTKIGSNAKLAQQGSSKILGKGIFGGSGTYRWVGGVIYGNLTLASTLASTITGSDPHEVSDALSSGGPGILTVEGPIIQANDAEVLLNGTIVNNGTWDVPADAAAQVRSGGGAATPRPFRNAGTVKVENGGELVLDSLQYTNPAGKGVIQGGGTVVLSNGVHELHDGGTIRNGTVLGLRDRAEVHGAGTLNLASDATVIVDDRSALRGTFTIGGSRGDVALLGGTIYGDVTTGPNVDVRVQPGDVADPLRLDAVSGAGILRTHGVVVSDGANPFVLAGPAQILTDGSWLMRRATFSGTGCCSDPATFVNESGGLVQIKGSAEPAAQFSSVRYVNRGTTKVTDVAQFDDLSPVQAEGRMTLEHGSEIVNELPLRISGGVLQGVGTVAGDLRNAGTVNPGEASTLGTLAVLGAYRQSAAGHLTIDVKGAGSDRVTALHGLGLAGTLRLVKGGTVGPEDRVLLGGTGPRTGTFGTVVGLGTLGAGWHVRYTPTSVRLELP
jgi:hypothetical protein